MTINIIKKEDTKLSLATRLHAIEREIEYLETDKKMLRDELLLLLKKQGVKSVKLEDGTLYLRAEKTTLKVKKGVNSEDDAWKWAMANNAVKIDTNVAWKILRRSLKKMPKFFVKSTSEYLTIKRPNQEHVDE